LEELTDGMRPLNPSDTRTYVAPPRLVRDLQRDPRILGKMILRDIAATVKIQGKSGSALFEGLAQKIDSANDHGQGFRNSFTAAPVHGMT